MEEDSVVRLKMIDETDRGMRSISSNLKTVDQNFAKVTAATIKAAGGWQKWEAASLKASAEAAKHQAKSIEVQQKSSTEIQRILDRETRARMDAARRVEDSERKKSEASNRSARETERHSQRAARAVREHAGVVSGALGGMASRYLGAAAAAEAARRAFMGAAEGDDKMRRMQNRLSMTREETLKLEKSIRELGTSTGHSFQDAQAGVDELSDRLNITGKEAVKVGEIVGQAAKAAGVSFQEMGVLVGQTMINLKIAPQDAAKAVDVLTKTAQTFGLNLGGLLKNAPRLTEVMASWGYTGTQGLEKVSAFLGVLEGKLGSSEEAAAALVQVMRSMGDADVAAKLNMSQEKMLQMLRASKDPLGLWIGMIEEAMKKGLDWTELNNRSQGGLRALFESRYEMLDYFDKLHENQGETARQFRNIKEGSKESIGDVIRSLVELRDEFGKLLAALGVGPGLAALADVFRQLREDINVISSMIEKLKKGDFAGAAGMGLKLPGIRALINPPAAIGGAIAKHFMPGADPLGGRFGGLSDKAAPMTDEQRRLLEAYQKNRHELEEHTRALKKMSYVLPGGDGGPRVWNASYGGPGGARVWNASYGGGGGGGGGYGGHGGAGAYQGGGGGYGGYSGGGGGPGGGGGGGGGPGASPGGGASGRGAGAPGPASGSTPTMGAGNTNWGNVGSSGYWKTGTDASGKSAAPAEAGGTGGAGGGSGGSSALPANILSQAQEMAKLGPGPLSAYMKSVGYPKNDAWCGDFAATAVKAAGGTPPKNPQIASNWRNFGTEVTDPQPGDIAVRRPEYHGRLGPGTTGSAGSHVNIVESSNATTFGSIGGNQDRRAEYARKQFQFYRGGGGSGQQEASTTNAEGAGEGLKAHVREMEGFSSESYGDYGQTTHGYGTSGSGSISEADARKESGDQVDAAFDKVSKRWPDAPIGVRRALASLEYNSNFMDKSKERATALREALDRKDYASARQLFSDSKHVTKDKQGRPLANEKVLPGLEDRRNKELARYWDDPKQQTQSAGPGASSGKGPDLKGYAKEGVGAERDYTNDTPPPLSRISDRANGAPPPSKSYNEWDTLPPTDDNQKYPGRSRTDILKDEERIMDGKNKHNLPNNEEITHPESRGASFNEAKSARSELEKPIKVNFDMGAARQFARYDGRRAARKNLNEERENAFADIGAA